MNGNGVEGSSCNIILSYYNSVRLEELKKTSNITVSITEVTAKIRKEHHP
jgi:hypothetical protein